MIAVSGLLVLVAFVSLVVGIFQPGLGLIYVSIASSVLAAISLATGVVKTRPKAVAVGAEPLGSWGGGTAVTERPEPEVEEAPVTSVLRLEEALDDETVDAGGDEDEEQEEVAPKPRVSSPARKAPAKKTAAKKVPAKKAASRAAGTVVVIPGRDKFHKESCRYATGDATQTLTKAAAKKEGYVACGVCKP